MKKLILVTIIMLAGCMTAIAISKNDGSKAARIASEIRGKSFSVSDAVQAAEQKTGGQAVACEIEVEDGRAVVEVLILKNQGGPVLYEVEVDGESNGILEIEQEVGDDDDDDDGGDGDDGDDGDNDDDDDDGDNDGDDD